MGYGRGRLTILIAARNAAATVERAVASCLPEDGCDILLADDRSSDGTADAARAVAGPRLRVVQVPDPGGVSAARQCALHAAGTEYAAWLDADDEWIPGRAGRLLSLLAAGNDVATEAIDLHDGPSGRWLRRLDVPAFLTAPGGFVRLFERNLLPGDTQVAFRTRTFKEAGGYDPRISGPESYDLLLRVLRRGGRFTAAKEAGYRMYAYPTSLSRDLTRQRAHLAAVLEKHPYEAVRRVYLDAGFSARVTAWALVVVAQYRDDHPAALRHLEDACPDGFDPAEVLEPDGPWPFPEGWREAFHRGTILLGIGGRDEEAAECLRRAEHFRPAAEGANNLAVALARMGRRARSTAALAAAVSRFPGYVDATANQRTPAPWRITTHPLRHAASRHEYAFP